MIYYFLTEQVKALVQAMADAFPGGVLVFDAANRTAVKMIAKTWLKSAKIRDVGAYFAVSDAPKEIGAWDNRLQVTSRVICWATPISAIHPSAAFSVFSQRSATV